MIAQNFHPSARCTLRNRHHFFAIAPTPIKPPGAPEPDAPEPVLSLSKDASPLGTWGGPPPSSPRSSFWSEAPESRHFVLLKGTASAVPYGDPFSRGALAPEVVAASPGIRASRCARSRCSTRGT